MILANRGVSVDRNRRSEIRKNLKPDRIINCIESLMAANELRLMTAATDKEVNEACAKLNVKVTRERIYTPAQALSMFVLQSISRDEACSTVIKRFNKERKEQALTPASQDASAYCKARSRLPISLINGLIQRTGSIAREKSLPSWKWMERNVYLIDGFVLRAPDTMKNQQKYPQPTSQMEGLGFPQVRVVAATSLATGCIEAYKTAAVLGKHTGEVTLFRGISDCFKPGDIVVGDSLFESYYDIARLQMRSVDAVFCINGTRKSPLVGQCKVIDESLQTIAKPQLKLSHFTREQWNALPPSITYRIIRYQTTGRRPSVTIVTTLLDKTLYPAKAIAELYGLRWDIEIDIGCFKTTMAQGELRCLTPENIDREIAVSILAYNIVRLLTNDAAHVASLHPREISFSHSRDAWITYGRETQTAYDLMWIIHGACARFVRDRPGRQEPREIKKRHVTKYPTLKKPRPSRMRILINRPSPPSPAP
jgi:Transposase DDE domain